MNAKITRPINTPEQTKELAQTIVSSVKEERQGRQLSLESALNEIKNLDPSAAGFDEIAALLSLSEEAFALLAPVFLSELEQSFNNINDQLALVQAFNLSGLKAEDLEKEYKAICQELDIQMKDIMSNQKIDFIKQLLALTYNAAFQAEGIAKRHILIPIEYCREDAKMPIYAHPTDAGMDVYLTEDVTINPGETVLIPTGIKCAIPLGYELQVRPKSGRSLKSKLRVANTPGTIDAGYRDEIGIIVDNIDPVIRCAEMDDTGRLYNVLWGSPIHLEKGEKIAQLVLSEVPKAIFYEVESVADIGEDRQGGFGSTGVK